jgi:hypothetical protein
LSYARDQRRKERFQARCEAAYADGSLTPDDVAYRKSVKNKIRKGILPRWTIVKDPNTGDLPKYKVKRWKYNEKTDKVEPILSGWKLILISTIDLLCKKIPQLK